MKAATWRGWTGVEKMDGGDSSTQLFLARHNVDSVTLVCKKCAFNMQLLVLLNVMEQE